jgi:hypothetical protein
MDYGAASVLQFQPAFTRDFIPDSLGSRPPRKGEPDSLVLFFNIRHPRAIVLQKE